jgi:hypothetical protein
MSAKPSDYFLGALEFFGVLGPGALFTYAALKLSPGTPLEQHVQLVGGGTEGWVVFFAVAFVIGWAIQPPSHVLNWLYDHTYREWKRMQPDDLLKFAEAEVRKSVPNMAKRVSVYRWAEVEVTYRDRNAAGDIALNQGVSKLFRGLTLFCLLACGLVFFRGELWLGCGFLLGAFICFLVFAGRRWHATCLVYQRFKAIREADQAEPVAAPDRPRDVR